MTHVFITWPFTEIAKSSKAPKYERIILPNLANSYDEKVRKSQTFKPPFREHEKNEERKLKKKQRDKIKLIFKNTQSRYVQTGFSGSPTKNKFHLINVSIVLLIFHTK